MIGGTGTYGCDCSSFLLSHNVLLKILHKRHNSVEVVIGEISQSMELVVSIGRKIPHIEPLNFSESSRMAWLLKIESHNQALRQ